MAKIKLTAPVSDIRGQLGGVVYSNWRGQAYTRNLAASVANPNSLFQERIRNNMTTLAAHWLATLSDAQRQGWEEYARQQGAAKYDDRQTSRGSLCPPLGRLMSGKNAFIGLNAQLARSDIAYVAAAPLGINAPSQPKDISASRVTTTITVTWTDPADLEVGGKASVWGYSPGFAHKQIVATVDKATQTLDITAMRSAGGVSTPLIIGLYRFQVVAWDTHGQRSPGSNIAVLNVPTLA